MAFLVQTDDDDVIHASTHGMMSRSDLSFLRERMDTAVRMAGRNVSKYLSMAKEKLDTFDLGLLKDKVEGMRDRFGGRWDSDRVLPLINLREHQLAKPKMRGYMMANPRARRLFHLGRLDGYDGLYVDDEPGMVGRDHSTYREVMTGAYVPVGEGDDYEDRFVTYMGTEDDEGQQPLSQMERSMIRDSWSQQDAYLDQGKQDPTSPLRKTL